MSVQPIDDPAHLLQDGLADERRRVLVSSGLFDVRYYRKQAGLADEGLEDCIDHYLNLGAAAGYGANPLFDEAAYLARYPDVAAAGVDAFVHFVVYGIAEGRENALRASSLATITSTTLPDLENCRLLNQAEAMGWTRSEPSEWVRGPVSIYASSLGNFFFRQIADRLADALRSSGVTVFRLDQNSVRPRETVTDFVVAPHEFFVLGGGPHWRDHPGLLRGVMLNTEQPGTNWYFLALHHAGPLTTMVDLSPQSACFLREFGRVRSGYLPLGWVPAAHSDYSSGRRTVLSRVRGLEVLAASGALWLDAEVEQWRDRPIDVLFLGTLTPRRSQALGRLAPALAPYRCFIHAPTMSGGPLRGGKTEIGANESTWLARRSKVMLNLHRDDLPYLEWHRVMTMGVEQGAVVLSEPSLPSPGVEPERHFLTATLDAMPARLDLLLRTPEGETIAAKTAELAAVELAQRFDLATELRALAFLHTAGFGQAGPNA